MIIRARKLKLKGIMTKMEEWKQKKIITADMVISGETDIISDWGIDIRIDPDKVVFDQVIRQVTYSKTMIKELTLKVNANR